jgi:CHAD domain-containing protein
MPTKSKTPAPVTAEQTVSDAFATIMRHNFDYLLTWEETVRSGEDIEGVHQFRVSLRRMRSALSVFRNVIPKPVRKHWSNELRWAAGELGLARDLDVHISEGLGAVAEDLPLPGYHGLLGLAEARRAQVQEHQVRAMLDSDRYLRFKDEFPVWFESEQWEQAEPSKKQAKALSRSIVAFSRNLMDKQERKVLVLGSHVDRHSADEMHSLRIECKKLRYAAEFFRPLFAGMDDFIAHMKGLQELLGFMNDVAVMRKLLDDLLRDETDHETLIFAGGLIGWRTCDYHHMLKRFDSFWEEFIEAKHPWWKKSAVMRAAS